MNRFARPSVRTGLLMAILAFGLAACQSSYPNSTFLHWSDFAHQLILTHAWGFGEAASWNGPAWSISAEWAAYLTFPFLLVRRW